MSDEVEQPTASSEKKEERIDELDVIGGLLIRFFQKIINFLKGNKTSV
jgi:hypothetical protein